MKRTLCGAVLSAMLSALALPAAVAAEDPDRAKATAPPGHAEWASTLSGSYFVALPLKEQYDKLLARLESLRRDIDDGRVTAAEAGAQLKALRDELADLRKEIERTKVHVPIARVHSTREESSFGLGSERRLVITADQVKLLPSEDDKVHCVLEKICLSVDDKPADAELAAVKLVHRYGPAPEATTRKEDGPSGDMVSLTGLTWQEGNKQITLAASSPNAGGFVRGQWRRHATLTVRVPTCGSVTVRGGTRGLEVEGLSAPLVVTSWGAHDWDYNATTRIKGVHGGVTVLDFPIRHVEDVDGDVVIQSARDYANSGTQNSAAGRLLFLYRPLECQLVNLRGGLTAHFGRVVARLEHVRGPIDVRNDFGDTTCVFDQPLATAAHRIATVAGHIEIEERRAALGTLPVLVGTLFGSIRTNAQDPPFAEFNVGGGPDNGNWRGFRRKDPNAPPAGDMFGLLETLTGKAKPLGLVAVSQAGGVVFTLTGP